MLLFVDVVHFIKIKRAKRRKRLKFSDRSACSKRDAFIVAMRRIWVSLHHLVTYVMYKGIMYKGPRYFNPFNSTVGLNLIASRVFYVVSFNPISTHYSRARIIIRNQFIYIYNR